MFLFEELAITKKQTDVVRAVLARLAVLLCHTPNTVVRVHLVRGQRNERWYEYEDATMDAQVLRDALAVYSFDVMRALATNAKPPGFSDDDLFGWYRTPCTISGAAVHVHVEVFGLPSSKAARVAVEAANDIAAQLH